MKKTIIIIFLLLICLTSATFASSKAVVNKPQTNLLTSGLVGYWSFNGADTNWTSATAGTTNDLSGNNNTGTLTNMSRSASPAPGISGQALKFDGVDDYVDVGNMASSINKSQGSFSAWVFVRRYPNANQTSATGIIEVGSSASSNNGITLSPPGSGAYINMHYRTNGVSTNSTVSVPTGAWHNIVGTWTESTLTIYLDGALADSDNNGSITTATLNQARIGSDALGTAGQGFFDGSIDEVRVYNRALTPAEIMELYNLGQRRMR